MTAQNTQPTVTTVAMLSSSSSSMKRKRSGCIVASVNGNLVSKRVCTGKKSVRFSADFSVRSTPNYLKECSSAAEEGQLRSRLWYQSDDFSQFVEDRNQTIRIWHAVGGNGSLIEPNYCVRGLEVFSEMLVRNDYPKLRRQHVSAVLRQQKMQSCIQNGNAVDELIAQASRSCTHWAIGRAQRLAQQDAAEAAAYQCKKCEEEELPKSSSIYPPLFKAAPSSFLMSSSLSLQHGMPQTKFSSASAASRESLMKMGFSPLPNGSVDVSQLKRMNMMFLSNLKTLQLTSSSAGFIKAGTIDNVNRPSTLDLLNEALRASAEL